MMIHIFVLHWLRIIVLWEANPGGIVLDALGIGAGIVVINGFFLGLVVSLC